MKKILMTLALLCALALGTRADDVNYIFYTVNDDGQTITKHTGSRANPIVLTSDLIKNNIEDRLYNGCYVLNSSFTYDERIVIYEDVELILKDGCTLTLKKGIRINTNARLTIYAQSEDEETMGRIVAHGNTKDQAVIGGNKNYLAGEIIIHGGYIDAQATNKKGAAIGGGYGDGSGMKTITIYGGKVIAKGYDNGAGLGAAEHNNYVGDINIYGGDVEAIGGKYAAGIGGAEDRGGWNTTIYGGIVTAEGGIYAAGIGGGEEGNGGVITIKGGMVNATGNDGAGIGGGYGSTTGGTITISGGSVTAKGTKGSGAGIGSGRCCDNSGTIIIEGDAHVVAKGGGNAAGIGAGRISAIGCVIIRGNAYVEANGGNEGAGIGTGLNFNPEGSLTISGNAFVWATGIGGGAGIGGNYNYPGFPVTIESGTTVRALGSYHRNSDKKTTYTSAAIGGGADTKDGSTVTIANGATLYLYTDKDQDGNGVDRFAIGRSHSSMNTGTLTLGDNLRVIRANASGSETEYISSDNRIAACQLEQCDQLRILPCDHGTLTYKIVGDKNEQHVAHCKYCTYMAPAENHSFDQHDECTVCHYQASEPITVNVYSGIQAGVAGYERVMTTRILKNNTYTLPYQYGLPGYMEFEGWLKDPDPVPTNWEMTAGEELLAPGTEIKPEGTVNLYARYSYHYGTSWTWSANNNTATATLTIVNLENYHTMTTITGPSERMQINVSSISPTAEYPGSVLYTAQYNYTDPDGRSFNFIDHCSVPVFLAVSLDEDDNTTTLDEYDGGIVTATLTDRTLYKDGSWNTLCLPFDVNELGDSPLRGATLKEMTDASFNDGTLTLTFADATSIKAGQAYLIKWDSGNNLEPANLVFTGVTLNQALREDELSTDDSGTTAVTFTGTYKKRSFEADDRTVLYLGSDNQLYYPQNGATIGAQRAYFQLSGLTAGEASPNPSQEGGNAISAFALNFGDGETTTGMIEAEANSSLFTLHSSLKEGWYSLDGRRLSGKPTAPGLYINNGKKHIIK